MKKCHVCGSTESHREHVDEIFTIKGRRLLVEKIPARVCSRCGDASFSRTTAERVRKLVNGPRKQIRKTSMDSVALS